MGTEEREAITFLAQWVRDGDCPTTGEGSLQSVEGIGSQNGAIIDFGTHVCERIMRRQSAEIRCIDGGSLWMRKSPLTQGIWAGPQHNQTTAEVTKAC